MRPIRSSIANKQVQPKALISAEARNKCTIVTKPIILVKILYAQPIILSSAYRKHLNVFGKDYYRAG